MREFMEEYGEFLLGAVIAIVVFGVVQLVLPMIKDVVPGFLSGLMGG